MNIENGDNPIELELKPDGTLAGSGPVHVSGRVLTDVNENNAPVFKCVTDTCVLGILTPN